jgi:hypothetical protein
MRFCASILQNPPIMNRPSGSGASLTVVFTCGALLAVLAACGTNRGSLRRGTEDPRAGDPVSAGQPPPPPPARSPEVDPDNTERRFGHGEARARRDSMQSDPDDQDREEVVVENVKPPAKPPSAPPVTPATYRSKNVPDAGAPPRAQAAPRR